MNQSAAENMVVITGAHTTAVLYTTEIHLSQGNSHSFGQQKYSYETTPILYCNCIVMFHNIYKLDCLLEYNKINSNLYFILEGFIK